MSKINVAMYGGKGILSKKEKPLEVEITSCPVAASCSFFKEGTCLSVKNVFNNDCKFSTNRTVKGYTRKAKKYLEFKNKWESDEHFKKLEKAPRKLGLADNTVILPYPHMVFVLQEDGSIKMEDPWKSNKDIYYIPLENFTVENIYKIVENKPQALMGGVISSYQEEVIPKFLSDFKDLFPDLYLAFTKKYPKYKKKEINYVGRKAYLTTLRVGSIFVDKEETWEWDGKHLTMIKGPLPYFNIVRIHYTIANHDLVLEVNEQTVIEVTDNKQVLSTTKFAD